MTSVLIEMGDFEKADCL